MEPAVEVMATDGQGGPKSERFREADLEEMVAVATRVASHAGEHKAKAFEMVLASLLRGQTAPVAAGERQVAPQPGVAPPTPPAPLGPQVFPPYLASAGVTRETLQSLIDIDSGTIIARNLGKAKSEQQRKIAVLLAVRSAVSTGSATVSQDDLVTHCKNFSCYDSGNFTANMGSTKTEDDRTVFLKTEDGWKVTVPGESFVLAVVRSLLTPNAPA